MNIIVKFFDVVPVFFMFFFVKLFTHDRADIKLFMTNSMLKFSALFILMFGMYYLLCQTNMTANTIFVLSFVTWLIFNYVFTDKKESCGIFPKMKNVNKFKN